MRSTICNRNRLHGFVPTTLNEVDSLFDQVFGSGGVRPTTALRAPLSLWEEEDRFRIELDVPGVNQEDVELTFDKGLLSVSVQRKAPEGERKNWHNEQFFGKLARTVSLPESADPESIEAQLTNGVLHVTVAKVPEVLPKRIEIKVN